ncbi:MCP four helix bundle domain-containing protein [Undibacterium sp. CY18W]|uniref:MCP four helix bundle domain-containing protein n=1 Tax=Undibacterium hunanense TaxID=2762292 RepID=A0ABR6ZWE8_9BURK|nr:methyl-accepting chemotaxis protein [Undibacterium hunanense]MBC3920194.1 MCP four helix bundle domain-containing protein [Undibacterium hunanense]
MKLRTPNIGIRLGLGFTAVLLLLAVTAWLATSNLKTINDGTHRIVDGSYPKVVLAYKMLGNVNANARSMRNMLLLNDQAAVEKEQQLILSRRQNQEANIAGFEKLIVSEEEKGIFQTATDARNKYGASQKEFLRLTTEGKKAEATTWLLGNLQADQEKWFSSMDSLIDYQTRLVNSDGAAADTTYLNAKNVLFLVAVLSILLAAGVAYWMTRSITRPVSHLVAVMQKLTQGDANVRARSNHPDEIGKLSRQFDKMVDEREASRKTIEEENEKLNESVLVLLQAVAQLASKDLTVKVPVSADVTGAVSDALNMLTSETAKVLRDVSNISADVTEATMKVKAQSDNVMAAAAEERLEVEHTTLSLSTASEEMRNIADLAQTCNRAADNAIRSTQLAMDTVTSTVGGINSTREIIRETEKRIKRLGERSQEISGVVGLINAIAERTHILALNASMHAASAGEAGRGFAVVADEVQRLAENARQATLQISGLVNNIQLETSDTVNTMNSAIAQVVEGSRLAEQAGLQMQATQNATTELVQSVQQIAVKSHGQAKASQDLLDRAIQIKKTNQETSLQLDEQSAQTTNLVEYARMLLSTVRVFKLAA